MNDFNFPPPIPPRLHKTFDNNKRRHHNLSNKSPTHTAKELTHSSYTPNITSTPVTKLKGEKGRSLSPISNDNYDFNINYNRESSDTFYQEDSTPENFSLLNLGHIPLNTASDIRYTTIPNSSNTKNIEMQNHNSNLLSSDNLNTSNKTWLPPSPVSHRNGDSMQYENSNNNHSLTPIDHTPTSPVNNATGFTGFSTPVPSFQRTRSLCYRKKKKTTNDDKNMTVPRRKYQTSHDDTSFDYYTQNRSNNFFNDTDKIIHEENVADITEKIITNINDHLERFEKNQNGELERDNKLLGRDNAILKEKIRMLEELMRENELKADNKLTELITANRKYMCDLEKEKTEEIQRLMFRVHSLEKQTHDQDIINERLQNLVETCKKENNELTREIGISNETNQSLRESYQQMEDKYARLQKRLDKQALSKDMVRQDLRMALLNLKQDLRSVLLPDSTSSTDNGLNEENEQDGEDSIEPESILIDLKQLISQIKEDKDRIAYQKTQIMNDIMESSTHDMLYDDHFINNNNNHASVSEELLDHFHPSITNEAECIGNNGIPLHKANDNLATDEIRARESPNPFPQDDDTAMVILDKENKRLKKYIDRLLLIILETQPALLEIKTNT